MTNMSYCRFHNTLVALRDCEGVLEDMVDGDPRKLSDEELIAAQQLAATCVNIVQILAERGAVDFGPDMDLGAVIKALNDEAN
jgi:hypothetical protein